MFSIALHLCTYGYDHQYQKKRQIMEVALRKYDALPQTRQQLIRKFGYVLELRTPNVLCKRLKG